MTIAIAQRRGNEILLVADTKITNKVATRPDELPGRLKVVTLAEGMTAAFAGDADPAYIAIREARAVFRRSGADAAFEVLKQSSTEFDTDYLVAVHKEGCASLRRLRMGGVLDVGEDVCAIGAHEPFERLIETARANVGERLWNGHLRTKFVDLIMTGKHGEPSVGGFPIVVRATANGHRYVGHTGLYIYKFPPLKTGEVTEQPLEQLETGDGHFQLTIAAVPAQINVPVVGACLPQARRGYVYSPLERPCAFEVELLPRTEDWYGQEREMGRKLNEALLEHAAEIAGQ